MQSIKRKSKDKKSSKKTVANSCGCVSSYMQALESLIPLNDAENIYCFRGQAVSNWGITASLARYPQLNDENKIKEMYEETVRNFPNNFSKFEELTFEDLAKMQHYEIPTALIDVSLNPLVSLFFAAEKGKGARGVKSGIVYVFKIPKSKERYMSADRIFSYDNPENEVCFVKTNYSNERIKSQKGAFIYNPKSEDLLNNGWIFHRFLIENNAKKRIRDELSRLNISYRTLFPELSEFRREIEERFLK